MDLLAALKQLIGAAEATASPAQPPAASAQPASQSVSEDTVVEGNVACPFCTLVFYVPEPKPMREVRCPNNNCPRHGEPQ